MRVTSWLSIFAFVALFGAGLASGQALELGDGLSVEPPETLDLTYQVIPAYDSKKKVLAGWDGKALQYFIGSAQRLPPQWRDANKYLTGLERDLRAASAKGAVTIGRKGNYKSTGGLIGTYMEYSIVLRGESTATWQIVNFLADSKASYIAFVTIVNTDGRDKLLNDSLAIFRTALLGEQTAEAQESDETKLVGKWVGSAKMPDGQDRVARFELKPDLSFVSQISVGAKTILNASGVWTFDGKLITWNYMYSSPALPEEARMETDEVVSFDGQKLTTVSKRSGQRHEFTRVGAPQ